MIRALTATVAALAAAGAALADDGTEIAFDEAPQAARETALDTAPGVKFERVGVEIEDGVTIYEFEGRDGAGRRIEIDVLEDGTLEEIEMEVSMDDVPDAVKAALEEAAPGFTPTYVQLSVRDGGGTYVYEFKGAADSGDIDLEIDEGGEVLAVSGGAAS